MKKNGMISLAALLVLAVLLSFVGCSATVESSVGAQSAAGETVAQKASADLSTAASDAAREDVLIGEEQAKTIALEHAGLQEADVTRLHVEYEIDDGIRQYDVEFHHGEYEYEYEINAQSGAIISADKDRED